MNHTILGLDLAKSIFHSVELAPGGKRPMRKKFSRGQLKEFMANRQPSKIAMEARASAHYWARLFEGMGHEVILLPPQHVKGYLRNQKNDYNDALAIAEACHHGAIRPAQIKSVAQQDEQALLRIRTQRVGQKTQLSNQMRGLLGEYGIVFPQGMAQLFRQIPLILEDADNTLTPQFRELLHREYEHLLIIKADVDWCNQQLEQKSKQDLVCKRLMKIPGFGPVVSCAVKTWMGDGQQFNKGRHASAALGLVPRQHTSGDKIRLMGITKRGDKHLRSTLVNGARAVVNHAEKKTDPLSQWINRLRETHCFNKVVIALANKLIRMAWVVISRGEDYHAYPGLAQGQST